jgi:hypothetical protein
MLLLKIYYIGILRGGVAELVAHPPTDPKVRGSNPRCPYEESNLTKVVKVEFGKNATSSV